MEFNGDSNLFQDQIRYIFGKNNFKITEKYSVRFSKVSCLKCNRLRVQFRCCTTINGFSEDLKTDSNFQKWGEIGIVVEDLLSLI